MEDSCCSKLQDKVSEALIRHRSIIDVLSKLQDSGARLSRSVAKAATVCGCIEIDVKKQQIPEGVEFSKLSNFMDTHVRGELCEECREILEKEIGRNIFYLVALCEVLDLDFEAVLSDEYKHISTLGAFTLA